MLLSLFTPTHKPHYLARLARSITNQTFTNFEWVIVPNGNAEEIHVDLPQARIVPYTGRTQNIGELKKFACQACRGDVVVEVDHDDELTTDCLTELAAENRGGTTRSSAGATARSRGMASPSSSAWHSSRLPGRSQRSGSPPTM